MSNKIYRLEYEKKSEKDFVAIKRISVEKIGRSVVRIEGASTYRHRSTRTIETLSVQTDLVAKAQPRVSSDI